MNLKEAEFMSFIRKFDKTPFKIIIDDREHNVGKGSPVFTVRLSKPPKVEELLKSTSLALGEAYMQGDIDVEGDLYTALCCLLSQMDRFSSEPGYIRKIIYTPTTKRSQKKEVTYHYDLGNDFYRLWLDDTMSYSCAYFKKPSDTLEEAQRNKTELILDKLYLKEGMTLCDIGCGWGFLLTEAAKKYKIKGLGITLSTRQKEAFEEKIKAEGLEEYLSAELMDYRSLPKLKQQFDRVVSVGMLEHVGRPNYELFISTINKILKPEGLVLLHFISSLNKSQGDPWIKKYIFPGGVIPSIGEITELACTAGFHPQSLQSLRPHYAKTLLCWHERFEASREAVVNMFDEEFARMWELYLCSCAAAFTDGIADVHQLLMTKGINNSLPLTPWY